MASLTDIVGRVIDSCDRPGLGIDLHRAIEMAVPLVMDDPEALGICVRHGLAKDIKDAATRATRSAESSSPDGETLDLFGKLRARYAVDIEGRVLKNTRDLSRLEFQRLIAIREAQIVADQEHLTALRDAAITVSPLWDINPAMAFGHVVDLYRAARTAAE